MARSADICTAKVAFETLRDFIAKRTGVERSFASPLTALFAVYGQRSRDTDARREARRQLGKAYDETRRERYEALTGNGDDSVLHVETSMFEMELQRGLWPLARRTRHFPSKVVTLSNGARVRTEAMDQIGTISMTAEPGMGKIGDRGLTDRNILITIGALIVYKAAGSHEKSISLHLDLVQDLGYPIAMGLDSAFVAASNTRSSILEVLKAHDSSRSLEIDVDEMTAAYSNLAESLATKDVWTASPSTEWTRRDF